MPGLHAPHVDAPDTASGTCPAAHGAQAEPFKLCSPKPHGSHTEPPSAGARPAAHRAHRAERPAECQPAPRSVQFSQRVRLSAGAPEALHAGQSPARPARPAGHGRHATRATSGCPPSSQTVHTGDDAAARASPAGHTPHTLLRLTGCVPLPQALQLVEPSGAALPGAQAAHVEPARLKRPVGQASHVANRADGARPAPQRTHVAPSPAQPAPREAQRSHTSRALAGALPGAQPMQLPAGSFAATRALPAGQRSQPSACEAETTTTVLCLKKPWPLPSCIGPLGLLSSLSPLFGRG